MMYMMVIFRFWKKRERIRTAVVELPEDIKIKSLTSEQIKSCDEKAKSLCHKGERVSGWKLLEEYELDMLKKARGEK